jgi:hypothetical protein
MGLFDTLRTSELQKRPKPSRPENGSKTKKLLKVSRKSASTLNELKIGLEIWMPDRPAVLYKQERQPRSGGLSHPGSH